MSSNPKKRDPLAMRIGANIRAFREEHGLGQRWIAEQTGIPRTQIGRYENAIEIPRLKSAIAISKVMDILIDELVFGKQHDETCIPDFYLRELFVIIAAMSAADRDAAADLLNMFIMSRKQKAAESGR